MAAFAPRDLASWGARDFVCVNSGGGALGGAALGGPALLGTSPHPALRDTSPHEVLPRSRRHKTRCFQMLHPCPPDLGLSCGTSGRGEACNVEGVTSPLVRGSNGCP